MSFVVVVVSDDSVLCCELSISRKQRHASKQWHAKPLCDVCNASAVGACSSIVWQVVQSQSRIKTLGMSHLLHVQVLASDVCDASAEVHGRQGNQILDMDYLLHAQVLASDVNIGYEEIVNTQVHQVNGKPVKNLLNLTRQIEGCQDQYLRFDLEYNQVRGALLQILPCSVLCLTHGMPSGFSLTIEIYTHVAADTPVCRHGKMPELRLSCAETRYVQFAICLCQSLSRGVGI